MARTKTRFPSELLIHLRREDSTSLSRQLEQELRGAIQDGRLAAEAVLPSTRVLAEQLHVSRGVVVAAYEQLLAEGYLTSVPRGGTRVSLRVHLLTPPALAAPTSSEPRISLAYARPDLREFPRQMWLRSVRRILDSTPIERLSYLDNRGAPELREALAAYLNRVRGTAAEVDRIVICNGYGQAMDLVVQLVKANGGRRIGVEEPGFRYGPLAIERHGLKAISIPVDTDGISVDALRRADVDAVFVTPAHHYPTGAVASPDRRAQLVAWARDRDVLILEDDYDAEYRYDRDPIGAMQGLDPEHVVYAGSASKTLAPGLRLGWMILPRRHVTAVATLKDAIDRGSSSLDQLAFADFLSRGEFDRHLRRMRPLYRKRRDATLDGIQHFLPSLRPVGASAGLHVLAWLPSGVSEKEVVDGSAALGVKLLGVSSAYREPERAPAGLIFAYGAVTPSEIEDGIRLVAAAVATIG